MSQVCLGQGRNCLNPGQSRVRGTPTSIRTASSCGPDRRSQAHRRTLSGIQTGNRLNRRSIAGRAGTPQPGVRGPTGTSDYQHRFRMSSEQGALTDIRLGHLRPLPHVLGASVLASSGRPRIAGASSSTDPSSAPVSARSATSGLSRQVPRSRTDVLCGALRSSWQRGRVEVVLRVPAPGSWRPATVAWWGPVAGLVPCVLSEEHEFVSDA